MTETTVTKANFEVEVLECEKTVLLDFWAPWCQPCRMLAPFVEEIAAEHPEIKVGKVNVDEQPELAAAFKVNSIPQLTVIKERRVVKTSVGLIPKEDIEALLR